MIEPGNDLSSASASMCTLYERLRQCVLEPSRRFEAAYGLGVIIVRGLAAWMEAARAAGLPDARAELPLVGDFSVHGTGQCRRLSAVLADVIITHCQQEA